MEAPAKLQLLPPALGAVEPAGKATLALLVLLPKVLAAPLQAPEALLLVLQLLQSLVVSCRPASGCCTCPAGGSQLYMSGCVAHISNSSA